MQTAKNKGKAKTKTKAIISRFALRASLQRYTPTSEKKLVGDPVLRQSGWAFGPAFYGTRERVPFKQDKVLQHLTPRSNPKTNDKGKSNSNSKNKDAAVAGMRLEKRIPPLRCGMTNKRTGNGKGKENRRSFDYGTHDSAVSASAQDDTFLVDRG